MILRVFKKHFLTHLETILANFDILFVIAYKRVYNLNLKLEQFDHIFFSEIEISHI